MFRSPAQPATKLPVASRVNNSRDCATVDSVFTLPEAVGYNRGNAEDSLEVPVLYLSAPNTTR